MMHLPRFVLCVYGDFDTEEHTKETQGWYFLDPEKAIKKLNELLTDYADDKSIDPYLVSKKWNDFMTEDMDGIYECIVDNSLGHMEPELLEAVNADCQKNSDEDDSLSEEARNLKYNWENFKADGLDKAIWGLFDVDKFATMGWWEDALERFRWAQKKMALADCIISPCNDEEINEEKE